MELTYLDDKIVKNITPFLTHQDNVHGKPYKLSS